MPTTGKIKIVEIHKFGEWVGAKPNPQPVVIVGVSVSGDGYEQLEIPEPV